MIINNYMSVLKPDDDRIDREIYSAIDDAVSGKFLEQMEEKWKHKNLKSK